MNSLTAGQQFLLGIAIAIVMYVVVFPYYRLSYLKDIAEELEKIRRLMEKECRTDI